jgi:NTP pyrophosphatase (non-canonical NTP hydrolase)
MKYYLYEIPGKKIGVTCDIYNRVTIQQGYEDHEYKILEMSEDIDYISDREIELQKQYGYRVDQKLYKNLKPKTNMNINVTEQTTTFPYPIDKLKGNLMDHLGYEWNTEHGKFTLSLDTVKWIMENVKTSMYNINRSYIYNKALDNFVNDPYYYMKKLAKDDFRSKPNSKKPLKMFENIRKWAKVRGLYEHGDTKTQLVKLQEEMGELAKATLENDQLEIIDAIGDMVVVLTNLAHLNGLQIETCIASAYNEISKRKGKMIDGTFVKTPKQSHTYGPDFIPTNQEKL